MPNKSSRYQSVSLTPRAHDALADLARLLSTAQGETVSLSHALVIATALASRDVREGGKEAIKAVMNPAV